MDDIQTWQQGRYIPHDRYKHMGQFWADDRAKEERHKVRSAPEENAICWCPDPEIAAWIAKRLNLAARLEAEALRTEKS